MKRLALASLLLVALPAKAAVPSFAEVRASYRPTEAQLLSREGETLASLRQDANGRRLAWTPLAAVSPAMQRALIAFEDRRFMGHAGVDWLAFGGALRDWVKGRRMRGASTLTMQLVALIDPTLREGSRRSVWRKFRQVITAQALERRWDKAEVLEAYLNLVTFRGELTGIQAASRALFGKYPHGLDAAEAAVLAALVGAPNAQAPRAAARACELARATKSDATCREIRHAALAALGGPPRTVADGGVAPHAARRLLTEAPDAMRSSLSARLQRYTVDTVRTQLLDLGGRNVHDAAVLAVDNVTGQVLAYVGGSEETTSAASVDGIMAKRQAGSILKPFLYGYAFEHKVLTPATLLDDSPLEIPVFGGLYRPRNYDRTFHGPVSARVALASSLNVPAVKTLQLVGLEGYLDTLRGLGFEVPQEASYFGPSLALGAVDVSLWELVKAYRALARQGRLGALTLARDGRGDEIAAPLAPEAAFLVSDVLADRAARAVTFGLESVLATRFPASVKTGTSKDMRDNWCVGYTDAYTVGVWVGNFDGAPMWDVSGVTGAGPIWQKVMSWLHATRPAAPATPPQGVVRAKFQGPEGPTEDWFVQGTAPRAVTLAPVETLAPKLTYPPDGLALALDPDIPDDVQALVPEITPATAAVSLTLDGAPLAVGTAIALGKLARGPHELALAAAEDGQPLDKVRFTVAGRGPDTAAAEGTP